MLVPFLCVLNLTKCYFFGCLKLRLFQGFKKCNYFLGMTEISSQHFMGLSNLVEKTGEQKMKLFFGGSKHSAVIFWGLKFHVCDFGG